MSQTDDLKFICSWTDGTTRRTERNCDIFRSIPASREQSLLEFCSDGRSFRKIFKVDRDPRNSPSLKSY